MMAGNNAKTNVPLAIVTGDIATEKFAKKSILMERNSWMKELIVILRYDIISFLRSPENFISAVCASVLRPRRWNALETIFFL